MPGDPKDGFEKWKDGVKGAGSDKKWDSWDSEIKSAVGEFNKHLIATKCFTSLDWKTVKAMAWVETGAASPQWTSKPLQIGVTGDPGLAALLSGNEGGDLILPPALKGSLTELSAKTKPEHNIRAGIGYLLMRAGKYEYQSVVGPDPKVYEVVVKPGDYLEKIAKAVGSTIEILKRLNPMAAAILKPGQTLKYQKGSVRRVITGWVPINSAFIKERYNGNRDPNYAKKIDFALSIIN